jgi:hypothetical protein
MGIGGPGDKVVQGGRRVAVDLDGGKLKPVA